MKIPKVDSCCGCIPLKNGVIVIGIIELMCSTYNVFGVSHGNTVNLANIVSITCASLLVYGTLKNKRVMLIPYLIHHLVGVILGVLLLLLLIFSSSAIEGMFENDDKESKELAKDVVGFLTIALILGLALAIFFMIVVYSYYVILRDEENAQNGVQVQQSGLYPVVPNEKFEKAYP